MYTHVYIYSVEMTNSCPISYDNIAPDIWLMCQVTLVNRYQMYKCIKKNKINSVPLLMGLGPIPKVIKLDQVSLNLCVLT